MRLSITVAADGRAVTIRADRYGSDIDADHLAHLVTRAVTRELADRGETYRREPYTTDELLDEWVFLRGEVPFRHFPARVGISLSAWEQAFRRAQAAGDPRAIRSLAERRGEAS